MKSLEGETVPLKNPVEITTKVEVCKQWFSVYLLMIVGDFLVNSAYLLKTRGLLIWHALYFYFMRNIFLYNSVSRALQVSGAQK